MFEVESNRQFCLNIFCYDNFLKGYCWGEGMSFKIGVQIKVLLEVIRFWQSTGYVPKGEIW
jgi:hypothetical protein